MRHNRNLLYLVFVSKVWIFCMQLDYDMVLTLSNSKTSSDEAKWPALAFDDARLNPEDGKGRRRVLKLIIACELFTSHFDRTTQVEGPHNHILV